MASVGTLYYSEPQVYKAQKALVTAKFNGIKLDAKVFSAEKDVKEDFFLKNPAGKVPFLQTDQGCIFTSMAIARYIAKCRTDTAIYGNSFNDEGMIDTWLDFCTHELEVPLMTWVYPCMGLMEDIPKATAQAKEDVKKALQEMEGALSTGPYLLGSSLTLADIALVCALKEGFARVFDDQFRKPFPKVTAWFKSCCGQPQFKAVLGDVALCSKAEGPKPVVAAKTTAAKETGGKKDKGAAKAQASPKTQPKGKAPLAAPAAAGGGDFEAQITAVGNDIRVLKEKLKGEGKSGKEINNDPKVAELVATLKALKDQAAAGGGGGGASASAAPAKASPKQAPKSAPAAGGADVEAQIKAVGDEIRELKEKLKGEGKSGKQINSDPAVAELVKKLQALKEGGAAAATSSSAKASPKTSPKAAPAAAPAAAGGIDEAAIMAVGDEIRVLKEKLKSAGKKGKEINNDPEVAKLVEKLTKLKKGEKVDVAPPAKKEPTPEEKRKAQLKKVIKEGGKRGVEIEGAADMGGLQFFCTAVDEPQGDSEMLDESMKAMNAKSDPTEEERKGGSGHIGKMLFSAGDDQLAIAAYIPDDKKGEISCTDWITHVCNMIGGKVVVKGVTYATAVVKTDSNKGIFPLKCKEPGITEAISFLKKKGLFPDKDDSDDEFVFGDDDFPDAADY